MDLSNKLIFFFSALGAFNSLILSVYFLFFTKQKKYSNYFLGGLLAVLSIRVWKSIFFYFNPDLSKIYLQIGLSACFFIGPLLYLYVKSQVSQNKLQNKNWLYLLLLLLVVTIGVGIIYPYEKHQNLWGDYFYKIINYQWLAFIIVSTFIIKDTLKKAVSNSKSLEHNHIWTLSVYFGVFIIWLAYFTSSYTSYILGALSFSFALYLTGLLLFYKKKNTSNTPKEKYANQKISHEDSSVLLKKLDDILTQNELYKNPNLTLGELSKTIHVRSHLLSQLLNDNLNKSFSLFINEYRIKAAKTLLKTNPNLKMEVIAEQSGFNSKSTFYAAFKKITNTTPAKYAKNQTT